MLSQTRAGLVVLFCKLYVYIFKYSIVPRAILAQVSLTSKWLSFFPQHACTTSLHNPVRCQVVILLHLFSLLYHLLSFCIFGERALERISHRGFMDLEIIVFASLSILSLGFLLVWSWLTIKLYSLLVVPTKTSRTVQTQFQITYTRHHSSPRLPRISG